MGEGSKWVKVGCMKERKGGDKGKGKGEGNKGRLCS